MKRLEYLRLKGSIRVLVVHDPRAGHGHVGDGHDDVSRTFVQLTTAVRHIVDPVTTVGRSEVKKTGIITLPVMYGQYSII